MLFSSLIAGLTLIGFAKAAPKASSTCSLAVATNGLQNPQTCGTYGSLDQTLVQVIDTRPTEVSLVVILGICILDLYFVGHIWLCRRVLTRFLQEFRVVYRQRNVRSIWEVSQEYASAERTKW